MPKCPKCGAEIEYLFDYDKVEKRWILDKTGLHADTSYDEPPYGEDEYECPLCHEVLFKDEAKAKAFLEPVQVCAKP